MKPLLKEIIQGVFHHYYSGFVGEPFKGALPISFSVLADRMVDEMGVDRFMEEILRAADQQEMTDNAFVDFLVERRVPMAEVEKIEKGAGISRCLPDPIWVDSTRKYPFRSSLNPWEPWRPCVCTEGIVKKNLRGIPGTQS